MLFRKRGARKKSAAEERQLVDRIQQELGGYLKQEELQDYLEKIKRDERRRKLWDSLSSRKKIKILRYVLEKKGGSYGRK